MKTTKSDPPKPFHLDLNLDDEVECHAFIATHGSNKGPSLALTLGLQGDGAANLATDLSNYAWIKFAAINARRAGKIKTALSYEARCDNIYRTQIQPVCDCW